MKPCVRDEFRNLAMILAKMSDDVKDCALDNLTLDTCKLVIKILQEIVVSNGDPNVEYLHSIHVEGVELTIDHAMRFDAFHGMTRTQVKELFEDGLNALQEAANSQEI